MQASGITNHQAILDEHPNLLQPIQCLDKGFLRLVDWMGGDQRVVSSARVSYGDGTKTTREDAGLINYLMKNGHTSPFEQVILTFHMKLPIFVARQVIRHRTARLNEISGRYSVMKDEFYVPAVDRMQKQATNNKQGSGTAFALTDAERMTREMAAEQREVYGNYEGYIEADMARELARINLPLSLYTEWYWQIDLHNLFHFMRLRLDWHAQYEVRVYAEALARCAQAVAPMCFAAFEEHVRHGERFSRSEMEALRRILDDEPHGLGDKAAAELHAKIRQGQ